MHGAFHRGKLGQLSKPKGNAGVITFLSPHSSARLWGIQRAFQISQDSRFTRRNYSNSFMGPARINQEGASKDRARGRPPPRSVGKQ